MIKIAISGKANSGKNTVASIITKDLNISDKEVGMFAFADPIKEMILSMFPEAKRECLFGKSELRNHIISPLYKDKKGKILTYRQALIDLGTLGRSYNNDIWVNLLKNRVDVASNSKNIKCIIVPDVRFRNEFSYLKLDNYFTIRLKRKDITKINDVSETQQDEIEDDLFDFVLNNNSSITDLENSVKIMIHNRLK